MTTTAISTNDRLGFTLFSAVALHAALILGVKFKAPEPQESSESTPITVSIRNEVRTGEADFLAQTNQEGSGSEEETLELTSVAPIMFGVEGQANDQYRSAESTIEQSNIAWEQSHSLTLVIPSVMREAILSQLSGEGSVMTQIEQLEARLHELQQSYAKRPRIRTLTSVATQASEDAAYLEQWRQRVEYIGNREYPAQARERRLFGELRLKVSVAANGDVRNVQLLKSSGLAILDNAAVEIVYKAAPFEPFPSNIRANADQLDIIRTWRFEPRGHLATN